MRLAILARPSRHISPNADKYVFIRIGWCQNQIYSHSQKNGSILKIAHILGVGTMRLKRSLFRERRHSKNMPIVPFKGSHGATIWGCRRKIPDRRSYNIHTEWIDGMAINWGHTQYVNESADELGVIYALIERFEKQRLPRLLELKKRVDKGGLLSESDIRFMYQVTLDAQRSKRLIDRHPEWHKFCAEVINLYEEIAEKTLENEKKS